MTACIQTFKSGKGDCIFLIIKEGEEKYVLMVDCGILTRDIKKYIKEECGNHINVLLVTHIDSDHILGVAKMLKTLNVTVGKIIYNCYKRGDAAMDARKMTDTQRQILNRLKKDLLVYETGDEEHTISVNQSVSLAETILQKECFKNVWYPTTITDQTEPLDLGKWGRLVWLSPNDKDVDALDEKYQDFFFEKFYTENETIRWQDNLSAYEFICRYMEVASPIIVPNKEIASDELTPEYFRALADIPANTSSISSSNKNSIAFIWESVQCDHRVLFLGDANPRQVCTALMNKSAGERWYDAIKVSHHGSHYNTTKELLELADSDHFFVTGGEEGQRPHLECLAKIVCREHREGHKTRHLHFNYVTQEVEKIKSNTKLRNTFGFNCDLTDNKYEFEC